MCAATKMLVLSVLALTFSFGDAKTVASRFDICRVKESNFQECFKRSAQKAITGILADGIPEFNFVALDSLFVPQMVITTGEGPVSLSLKFDNTTHTGIRTAQLVKSNADPKNFKFDLQFKVPYYSVVGPYEASGRIILLPITGKGISNFTYYDVDAHWAIEGKARTDSKGKKFMEPTKFDVKIHSSRAFIDMTNLFNGDKTLSDNMLKFLNDNQKEFIAEVEPALNSAFSELYLALAKQLFKKLPYDEMFPDLKN